MTKGKKILVASFQSLTAQSGSGMARLGYYISQELHKKNILDCFIVYSKGKFETSFPSAPVSRWSRYILYFINKLNKIFNFQPHTFRFFQEKLYDWFFSSKINTGIGILLVTQPYLKRTFKKAKKLGIKIIFIPGNPEENYIKQLVLDEWKYLNITGEDAYTYKKRIDYYNTTIKYVDNVIGTYPTVYTTYKNSQYQGTVTEMIGHIKPDFMPIKSEPRTVTNKTFIIGYLAHTVALKGLQYLLQAWDMMNNETPNLDIKLIIAGKIDDSIAAYVESKHLSIKKIELLGHVSQLSDFYKSLDAFVVPSLIDGGPYTALEAAHYSIPVIITENCGSAELLSRGNPGCKVVPIRDAEALKKEILWAYNNRAEAIKMGSNAKYNLENYRMDELVTSICAYLEKEINKINNQ
jgi:glycosyltransferase involved in cell wall biosynthesis